MAADVVFRAMPAPVQNGILGTALAPAAGMRNGPEPVVTPLDADATTGEVGSEGGSPGDLLRPSERPERDDADRNPRGVPGLVWVALLVPILVVLLWFATSFV
jgi:hypothetical protein